MENLTIVILDTLWNQALKLLGLFLSVHNLVNQPLLSHKHHSEFPHNCLQELQIICFVSDNKSQCVFSNPLCDWVLVDWRPNELSQTKVAPKCIYSSSGTRAMATGDLQNNAPLTVFIIYAVSVWKSTSTQSHLGVFACLHILFKLFSVQSTSGLVMEEIFSHFSTQPIVEKSKLTFDGAVIEWKVKVAHDDIQK